LEKTGFWQPYLTELSVAPHISMITDRRIWQNWVEVIHHWGMQEVVATLLEATGPLNFLGAQAIYLGQPLLGLVFPQDHVDAFAALLENSEETRAFTRFLRQAYTSR